MVTRKHIVIVDDDIYLAEMVTQILNIEGYTVTSFQDGTYLIENLDIIKPDLILLDIKMPIISGDSILKIVRSKSQLPVIMLTGFLANDTIAAYVEMGADDYIKKPFYPHELLARVKARLRRNALTSI
jgi:DNA-binding response OmpR family regulator